MLDLESLSRPQLLRIAHAARELRIRRARELQAGEGGLIEFVRYFWKVLEPNTPFVDGWALRAICQHLEAVTSGRINRLLINVSPGFAKSLISDVFWPAWEWAIGNPHYRYIAFSYASHLTERDNGRFRDLVSSVEYRELYGKKFTLKEEGKILVSNDKTGWKFASSVGGVGTGARGNRVILDDPLKVDEAESETVRRNTGNWFRESMQNRLNDLERDAIVVIMQRVHSEDPAGIIMDHYPGYTCLVIPMEYDQRDIGQDGEKIATSIGWTDPRTEWGELAWPERYPLQVLEPYKALPYLWSGQYQQSPTPRGGGIIQDEFWKLWDPQAMRANDVKVGSYPDFSYIVASFDGAYTEKKENDFSALTIWGVWHESLKDDPALSNEPGIPKLMLIAAWQKRLTLHGLDVDKLPGENDIEFASRRRQNWGVVEHIADSCRKYRVDMLLIESKATGHSVEQEMRRLYWGEKWSVQLFNPGRLDKTARVWTIQHLFADGMIWAPDTDWADMVRREFSVFPRGAHDDLVDSSVNAITWMRRNGFAARRDEARYAIEGRVFPRKPAAGLPYDV